MADATKLSTPRLLLRRWGEADLATFAAINADPVVMEYFPARLGRAESDRLVERIEAGFDAHGFGLWALELRASGELIGFAGLSVASFDARFTPAVEVGWRLARSAWRQGYATEAARSSLSFGFRDVGLAEIVSFTTVGNRRSRAVMERIGMVRVAGGDFEHPALAASDPLRRHVLYRCSASEWGEASL